MCSVDRHKATHELYQFINSVIEGASSGIIGQLLKPLVRSSTVTGLTPVMKQRSMLE